MVVPRPCACSRRRACPWCARTRPIFRSGYAMCRHTLGARASKAVAFGGCERHRRRAAPAGGRVWARREAGGTGSDICVCVLQPGWRSLEAGGTPVAASGLSECQLSRRHRAALRLVVQIGLRSSLRRHRPEGRRELEDELDHKGLRATPPSAPFRARPPRAWGDCA
jgi:hypothetical protein